MNTKKPPFNHSDGSNCWTENCSRGNTLSLQTQQKDPLAMSDVNELLDNTSVSGTHFSVLFSQERLNQHIKEELITRSEHPDHPSVALYKYSRSAQSNRNWTEVTKVCRGLIIDHSTGNILARPFHKFFNYQELTESEIKEQAVGPMYVHEKLDGSLIIGYIAPDGRYRLTTGGSFQSPQHKMAEEIYNEKYVEEWTPRPNTTYIWELIHPNNRIVVDYKDEKDLHLLGAVNIRTGRSIPLHEITEWKWKRADTHRFDSLDSVVSAPNRKNNEGYIVHFPKTDFRLKLKHEDYLLLHRDATGLSERSIWRYLKTGEYVNNKENIQEEFIDFYETTGKELLDKVEILKKEYYDEFDRLKANFSGNTKREWVDYVRSTTAPDRTNIMLSWYDSKKTFTPSKENSIWDLVKPEETRSIWKINSTRTED